MTDSVSAETISIPRDQAAIFSALFSGHAVIIRALATLLPAAEARLGLLYYADKATNLANLLSSEHD